LHGLEAALVPFDIFGTEEFNSLEEWTANINSPETMHLIHIAFSPVEGVTARWKVINVSSCFGNWVKMVAVIAAFHRDGAFREWSWRFGK